MKVLNCTPHPLVVFREEDTVFSPEHRKFFVKEGAQPALTIAPSGVLLNVQWGQPKTELVGEGIPVRRKPVTGIDAIPEDADMVIVSALFASSALAAGVQGCDRLFTIADPVYADPSNPRPVGCLGFAPVVAG
jgi:hypothetical protein